VKKEESELGRADFESTST